MRTKDIGLYWVGAILFVVACIGDGALYWNLNKRVAVLDGEPTAIIKSTK